MKSENDHESVVLIEQIKSGELLESLITQLKKDADLTGLTMEIPMTSSPGQLVSYLHQWLLDLMTTDFTSYLNFLYRVDIPESSMRAIRETDAVLIAQKATYLLLRRELSKVITRSKNR